MGRHEFAKEFWIILFKEVQGVKICSVGTLSHKRCWLGRAATEFVITSTRQQIDAEGNEDV